MKVIKTISSFALAVLVLASSSSFMIGIHVCMGKVQDVALFSKAETCEMEQSVPPCHKQMKQACCEDQTLVHEGKDFKSTILDIHLSAPLAVAIASSTVLLTDLIPAAPLVRVSYFNYDPPLPFSDLTIDHQVFLI